MNEKVLLGLVVAGGLVAIVLIVKNGEKKSTPLALLGAQPNSSEDPPGTAYQVNPGNQPGPYNPVETLSKLTS